MNDLERARSVPCPGCKMPAGSACIDLETGAEATGVHQVRIYRAYVVAEADAHNRAVELEAEVEQLRGLVTDLADREGCSYDHHGYCQVHGWMATEPRCPHARAQDLLAQSGGAS